MRQWEYLYVSISNPNYSMNDQQYKFQKGQSLFAILSALGSQGWELVTVTQWGAYVFKRLKS